LTACGLLAHSQTANPLHEVNRIYVDGFGAKTGANDLKRDLAAELRKLKAIQVVNSAAQADATLSGDGEIYLKGYYSLNPRAGVSPSNGEPIYGGSLSVELKDRNGETLWSYLATPRSGVRDAARELSKDVVKHLAVKLPNGTRR
jgi:hypothetical protein